MEDVYARYAEALRSGHQLAAEGKFKEALRHYESAAELAGERALPHINVGGMLLRLGKTREALAAYERALAHEPDHIDALSGHAAALLAVGRRTEAARVQERIATLRQPGATATAAGQDEATPISSADTLMLAGEQARRAANDEAAIDAWLAEAREHSFAALYDAALDACMRALSIDSSKPRIHLEMARIYFQRGWLDRAVERVTLLRQLLSMERDEEIRAALAGLVAEHAAGDARLAETPLAESPPADSAQPAGG
jgi:tetratricopeptide (TPR) repeat protein